MLIPAKTKYRKSQKGGKKILGTAATGNSLKFGSFGLKALEPGKLNSKQIESARKVITRYMKRAGKLWIVVFPHTQLLKSQLKLEWEVVKVVLNITSLKLNQVESSLKSMVSTKIQRQLLYKKRRRNCRLKQK